MNTKYKAGGTELFKGLSQKSLARLARVKLMILDVDGVLTDGGLYYGADGTVSKRFNVLDGLGITIARQHGLRFAVITGQDQASVAARLNDLKLDSYYPGCIDKRASYEAVRQQHGLEAEEVAFLGDDWVDLPVMVRVGGPLAVANAQPEVKDAALYVTQACGGHGAVREALRLIHYSKGQLDAVFTAWMEQYSS